MEGEEPANRVAGKLKEDWGWNTCACNVCTCIYTRGVVVAYHMQCNQHVFRKHTSLCCHKAKGVNPVVAVLELCSWPGVAQSNLKWFILIWSSPRMPFISSPKVTLNGVEWWLKAVHQIGLGAAYLYVHRMVLSGQQWTRLSQKWPLAADSSHVWMFPLHVLYG